MNKITNELLYKISSMNDDQIIKVLRFYNQIFDNNTINLIVANNDTLERTSKNYYRPTNDELIKEFTENAFFNLLES